MDLKRDEIKYVRDLAKSAYKKGPECFICSIREELQFHHFYSMTHLWNKWKLINKIKIKSVKDILAARERFKVDHHEEIYNKTVTLCKFHHMERLHKIYGKTPALATAKLQEKWCISQKEKLKEK